MFSFIGQPNSVTIEDLFELKGAVEELYNFLPKYSPYPSFDEVKDEIDAAETFNKLDGSDQLQIIDHISKAFNVICKIKSIKVLKDKE